MGAKLKLRYCYRDVSYIVRSGQGPQFLIDHASGPDLTSLPRHRNVHGVGRSHNRRSWVIIGKGFLRTG